MKPICYFCWFLACINGTFGLNCKYNCSGNCQDDEPCNSTDGTCASCSPGWDTVWCNKSKTDLKRLVFMSNAKKIKKSKKKKTLKKPKQIHKQAKQC